MSITTAEVEVKRPRSSPSVDGQPERFIERQLERTSSQVKLTDLASALMVLSGCLLAAVLVLAVVEHWVWGLATWARWLALLAIAGGSLTYAVLVLIPLVFRRINPAFAAHAIEQSEPSLKNSLINFLLFRSNRTGVSAAVFSALQQRAATDLSRVQVDTAVDRAQLIKVGYGLATVLTLFAIYTILSPKSPFQTLERIAVPWADIPRPSRVRIEDVQPGHASVFQGERTTISAKIYRIREGEPVELFYSTTDGQVTKRRVAMQVASGGLRYEGTLPPDAEGLQQDLNYWIVAGDATTPVYALAVRPAPTIWIEQLVYDYPAYTKRPRRPMPPRQGDIQALEGTRVTLHAQANLPIRSALIELQPDAMPATTGAPSAARGKVVELHCEGQTASCSVVLEMDATRTRSLYACYQLRFLTAEGQWSPRPVLHRIEVTRDLAPEIEILTPARTPVEVPADGRQAIEARAIDPDFGLSKITLWAQSGEKRILDRVLLDDVEGRPGQMLVKYEFRPREFGLTAGADVTYGLVAEDNRSSAAAAGVKANRTATATYHFTIVAPDKPDGFPTAAAPKNDKDPGAKPEAAPRPQDEPQEKRSDDKNQGADDQQMTGRDEKAQGGGGDGGEQNKDQSGGGEAGSQGQGGKPDGASGQGASGGNSQAGNSPPQESGAEGGSGGQATGRPGDPNAAGTPDASGGQGGGQGSREEPLHDGEVFEKMLERLQPQAGSKSGRGPDQGPGAGKPEPGAEKDETPAEGKPGGEPQDARSQQAGQAQPGTESKPADSPGKPADGKPTEAPAGANQTQSGQPQSAGAAQQPDQNMGAGQEPNAQSGTSGQPRGGSETGEPKQPHENGPSQQRQPGTGDNGQAGAGQQADKKQGAPAGEQQARDRQKKQDSGGGEKPQGNPEPQSPGQSKKQSDSQGGEGGDRAGGGKSGGGQGANQPGNDSAGSNSSGDEGAGAAPEPGTGDTSPGAGDKQSSRNKTGSIGNEKGPGSGSQPDPSGSAAGGKPGEGQAGGEQPTEMPSGSNPQAPTNQGPTQRVGGGAPGPDSKRREPDTAGQVPPGEKANLDYARKATDLVLEYLKDQQEQPDAQLLQELGWTPEDLRQFIQRWETLKRSATETEASRRELEESLRSLGLRPSQPKNRRVNTRDDRPGGLRELGTQSNPPRSYLEQFQAFQKGTARVESDRAPASPARKGP